MDEAQPIDTIEPIASELIPSTPTHFDEIQRLFRPSDSEHSMPRRVLVMPTGKSPEAQKHWRDTIAQMVRFLDHLLYSKLDEVQITQLKSLHPDGRAQFWGSRPVHDKKMANIRYGDLAVFTSGGHVVGIARVGAIFQNAAFADVLWPPKSGTESWHTVFSLLDFINTYIANAELNEIFGYKLSNHYQGLLVPDDSKAKKFFAKIVGD